MELENSELKWQFWHVVNIVASAIATHSSATKSFVDETFLVKWRIYFHGYLEAGAFTATAIGFWAIYNNKELLAKPHFATWHGLVGLIVTFAFGLQVRVSHIDLLEEGQDAVHSLVLNRLTHNNGVNMSLGNGHFYSFYVSKRSRMFCHLFLLLFLEFLALSWNWFKWATKKYCPFFTDLFLHSCP